jgi:tripartite ATP-independent transporter DctP family solute receptor
MLASKGRRSVLVTAFAAMALALLGVARDSWAQQPQRQTLRFGTAAIGGDLPVEMMYVFKEWVDRSAPGEFDVQIHHTGTLVRQGTEITALQRNSVEMSILSWWDIGDRIPEFNVMTVGYLFRDWNHVRAAMDGDIGREYKARIAKDLQIEVLDYYYAGPRIVNLREARKVETPADLAGVKLRMPGSPSFLLMGRALGANPVPLALPDVYLALKTGTIDGQDNPLPTNRDSKFYEVTKQIVLTSHLVDQNYVAFSKRTWDRLTPAQRDIVQKASDDASELGRQRQLKLEAELEAFFKERGLKVYAPDVDAFRAHVQKAYLESKFAKDWPAGMVDKINAIR